MEAPVWPLIELVKLLYLAGGYHDVDHLLSELPDSIEMEHAIYSNPRKSLEPYKGVIVSFLSETDSGPQITDEKGHKLDPFSSREALLRQRIIEKELETINSLLCGPMGCDLCCIGPTDHEKMFFFEIPLLEEEIWLFNVKKISTYTSRNCLSSTEPPLRIGEKLFYESGISIVEWMNGHSLILPRGARCPNLDENGRCRIYNKRPETCRRPQIFSYVVERDRQFGTLTCRNKMLAVSDCPYVKILREKIHFYASLCGMDLVITSNRK